MRTVGFLRGFFVVGSLIATCQLLADAYGLFVGFHGAVIHSEATYTKVLDNTFPDNPTPVAGQLFTTSNTGSGNLAGAGVVAGFRHLLDNSFISVQLELTKGAGRAPGFVRGEGISQTKAQLGEAWPETFEVSANSEFAIVGKWGRELNATGWTAISGFYALAGFKRVSVDLDTRFERGCPMVEPCTGIQFQSGEATQSTSGQTFLLGAGLEHAFSDRFVAQLEVRLQGSIEGEELETVPEGYLTVNRAVESRDLSFSIDLIRFL